MGPDSGVYKVVLVLHLMAVIVGFGGLAVNGFYGAHAAARRGREGAAVGAAVDKGYRLAEWPIYAVPVLGIVLVLMSDDAFSFSQAWISLSFVLYIVVIGLLHGIHLPTVRRINALLAELAGGAGAGGVAAAGTGEGGAPPQVAELDRLGAKAGLVGGIMNLLAVVVVFLMVFKPGFK
jgi:uncharacterized membrane protein